MSLDEEIENTYVKYSQATLNSSLYDSYIRAFSWSTKRIGEKGVIGFVTNGGWLDSKSGAGVRKIFADEFSKINVVNLKGNQRGDWRKEGGKVFGAGSQAGISIVYLVKNPEYKGECEIFYHDIVLVILVTFVFFGIQE